MSARRILWHDGYASNLNNVWKTKTTWKSYYEEIIRYAKAYDYDAIGLTLEGKESGIMQELDKATLDSKDLGILPSNDLALERINDFITDAEEANLQVALNVFQSDVIIPSDSQSQTAPIDQFVDFISQLKNNNQPTNQPLKKPLIIGVDSETNGLKKTSTTKDPVTGLTLSVSDYTKAWTTALDNAKVDYDTFAVFGGSAPIKEWYDPSDPNYIEQFVNAVEYYSLDGWYPKKNINGVFNDDIANLKPGDPGQALKVIQNWMNPQWLQDNKLDPEDAAPKPSYITNSAGEKLYNQIMPAFSIGTGNPNNTLGKHSNGKSIGPSVFGNWDPEQFIKFLDAWELAYPETADIFVYQADQLNTGWVPNAIAPSWGSDLLNTIF